MTQQSLGATGAALFKCDAEELQVMQPAMLLFSRTERERAIACRENRLPGWRAEEALHNLRAEISAYLAARIPAIVGTIDKPKTKADRLRAEWLRLFERGVRRSAKKGAKR